jgi:hypothetical protein
MLLLRLPLEPCAKNFLLYLEPILLDNSDIPAPDTPLLVPENVETDTTEKSSAFFVYLLLNKTGKCTYVGATIDLNHRLRQHNGEIKGGAKYNRKRKRSMDKSGACMRAAVMERCTSL